MVRLLIILAFSPLLVLVIHSIASQLITPRRADISRQLICIGSSLLGNIPMAIALWYGFFSDISGRHNEEFMSAFIYALIVYNALGYCYFHLFNMSETARRVRLLAEIKSAGRLTEEDISSIYDMGDMFDVRIKRLLAMKQIENKNNNYVLKGRSLYYTAKLVSFWAHLLGFHFLDRFEHK